MKHSTSYQEFENGELTGYIFKTYKREKIINGIAIIDILVNKNNKFHQKICFIKNSGKYIDIHEKIYLYFNK